MKHCDNTRLFKLCSQLSVRETDLDLDLLSVAIKIKLYRTIVMEVVITIVFADSVVHNYML